MCLSVLITSSLSRFERNIAVLVSHYSLFEEHDEDATVHCCFFSTTHPAPQNAPVHRTVRLPDGNDAFETSGLVHDRSRDREERGKTRHQEYESSRTGARVAVGENDAETIIRASSLFSCFSRSLFLPPDTDLGSSRNFRPPMARRMRTVKEASGFHIDAYWFVVLDVDGEF